MTVAEMTEHDVETVAASAEQVRSALETGGRASLSVRSLESGAHVSLSFSAKKRGEDRRFISRATIAGRVGIGEADVIFVDDPTLPWPDGKVGSFDLKTGEWRIAKETSPAREWAAQKVFLWALGRFPLEDVAEVFLELNCSFCGKPLTDPVSIERGIGPECYGRHTGSRSAAR